LYVFSLELHKEVIKDLRWL